MRLQSLAFSLLWVFACSSGGQTADPKPASSPSDKPASSQPGSQPGKAVAAPTQAKGSAGAPEGFMAACMQGCERRSMARAVGADMITRECKGECNASWALPAVKGATQLSSQSGNLVRVFGMLKGSIVVLTDESQVELTEPPGTAAILEGQSVIVVGVLEKGKLTAVKTIAPSK